MAASASAAKMTAQTPCAILPDLIALPPITSTARSLVFNYYGPVQPSLAAEASKFLVGVTDVDELDAKSAIQAFLRNTREDCVGKPDESAACWLTIRATKPTDEFQMPRWHQDGRMYPYDKGREEVVRSKYGLTLLGPKTLILEPDTQVFKTIKEVMEQIFSQLEPDGAEPSEERLDEADRAARIRLATVFRDATRLQIGDGQIVRFSWGREDSPVHSEPNLVSDRVFVTVLYGSERELQGMCEWRGDEYGTVSWG